MHLYNGDCLEQLRQLEDNSVDSVVTDPPYGLEFMGKEWDKFKTGRMEKYASGGEMHDPDSRRGKGGAGPNYTKRAAGRCKECGKQAWSGSPCKCENPQWEIDNSGQQTFQVFTEAWATECMRVLKPGGYLLAFGGSRMYHRLASGIEDAGFEIRDQIMWVYGSGFPKSHNVGKAVDKLLGNERDVVGTNPNHRESDALFELGFQGGKGDGTITKGTSDWEGWGTALKPAHEPIVMARKPFKGTVANNVLTHGTGAINIDDCRVSSSDVVSTHSKKCDSDIYGDYGTLDTHQTEGQKLGRFPANFIHDGITEEWGRYFYCPKASKKDRNAGCEGMEEKDVVTFATANGTSGKASSLSEGRNTKYQNNHPTVKPQALMAYLCRLVTQPGGVVLDPFMGSGSTGRAALSEGFDFVGIEREPEYFQIAQARITNE